MSESQKQIQLQFKFRELVGMWEELCKCHNALYELAALEYDALLTSHIDNLEELIKKKEEVIETIYSIDSSRKLLIDEIAALTGEETNHITDLYPILDKYKLDPANTIQKYNNLLLDIILKIQEQNKKNQIFLNKAILSLQDLKDKFKGNKNFKTYNSRGNTLNP